MPAVCVIDYSFNGIGIDTLAGCAQLVRAGIKVIDLHQIQQYVEELRKVGYHRNM
jgi:hypothetical protein